MVKRERCFLWMMLMFYPADPLLCDRYRVCKFVKVWGGKYCACEHTSLSPPINILDKWGYSRKISFFLLSTLEAVQIYKYPWQVGILTTQGKYNFFLLSILEVVDAVIPKLQQKFTGAAFYKSSVDKWTTVELDLLLHKPLEIDKKVPNRNGCLLVAMWIDWRIENHKAGWYFFMLKHGCFFLSHFWQCRNIGEINFEILNSMILKVSYLWYIKLRGAPQK